jgi:hypothetical protein
MERFARIFTLSVFALATGILVPMAVVLTVPERSFAAAPLVLAAVASSDATISTSTCSTPTFYSSPIPGGLQYTPWSIPLLSALEGRYLPMVTAKNLAPGITLQDATTSLSTGGAVLHSWTLGGAPTQIGTYAMTVTAQNECGGTATVITLPVSGAFAVPGQACPSGTSGTYPLCKVVIATTTAAVFIPAASTTPTAVTLPSAPTPTAVTNAAPAPAASCVAIGQTLRQGSRGSDVASLQNFLISKGFLVPGSATGYFGAQTRAAVQQFQALQGIASSGSEDTNGFGLVGSRTRAAMALGCGSSSTATNDSSTTVVPLTGLPQCPKVTVPACPGGNLISLGTDQNHCVLGYMCRTTSNALCPAVATPSCPNNGTAMPTGYDSGGCATGYTCQQLVCPTVPQPTCGAGQHIVTAPDAQGCASISYCVGGSSSAPATPLPNTGFACLQSMYQIPTCPLGSHVQNDQRDQNGCPTAPFCAPNVAPANTSPFSNFSPSGTGAFDINSLLQGLGFGSLTGGTNNGSTPSGPISTMPIEQIPSTPPSATQADTDAAWAAFYSLYYSYGSSTLTKCTKSDGTLVYIAKGTNSDNTKSETRMFPSGGTQGGSCTVVGAY